MNPEFVKKTIRSFVILLFFVSMMKIGGMDMRGAQMLMFTMGAIILFGLLLRNIWLTLFLWWTVLLFGYYKCMIGNIYVTNIFFGCVVYYLTKISFRKEHIKLALNGYLWLVAITISYIILQACNLDFIYMVAMHTTEGFRGYVELFDAVGFFGFKACMGTAMALAVPILLSRWNLTAKIGTAALFVMIYMSKSSMAMAGGIAGVLFVLWYKVNWKVWVASLVIIMTLGIGYVVKVDMPMGMMPTRLFQWKTTMRDAMVRPVVGWGLDSFRHVTPWKPHLYAMNPVQTSKGVHYDYWDNPHNLYVSLVYEWGIVGIFLLIGYIRQCVLKFRNAIKSPNTLALVGFVLVFFIVSFAQFPMFLARQACFIIPMFALMEIQIE